MASKSAEKRCGEIEQLAAAIGSPTVGQRRTGRAAKGVRCRRRYAAPPTHRLKIAMSSTRAAIIVDVNTSRPDVENYGINATYTLTEIGTDKVVVTGQTFARVSYDIPGQEQRFARVRGHRHGNVALVQWVARAQYRYSDH